jgi:hypothetical protein
MGLLTSQTVALGTFAEVPFLFDVEACFGEAGDAFVGEETEDVEDVAVGFVVFVVTFVFDDDDVVVAEYYNGRACE